MKTKCGICEAAITPTCSLGSSYISNFIPADAKSEDYPKSELTMSVCDQCGVGQLTDLIDPDVLYSKYWYYSGVNQTMHNALFDVVKTTMDSIKHKAGDVWLDIASNDGTLLSYVPSGYVKIGIDPADSAIQDQAREHGNIVNEYFSADAFYSVSEKKAKVITCIAMFYDLPYPGEFLRDVYEVLEDDGVFVIQISYTPLMLQQLEFGNICAEHTMYYSLTSLQSLLLKYGFGIVDCTLNDTNGGSFRVFCTKMTEWKHFRNPQLRDIGQLRVQSLLAYERGFEPKEQMLQFFNNIYTLGTQTSEFIKDEVLNKGKLVYGYGASTKGNTLLQYFGLDNTLIDKIADRNSSKWGLKTIGTEIPICPEQEARDDNPDYMLILPWHFIEEFKTRERAYLSNGGKFIVPSPRFEVI